MSTVQVLNPQLAEKVKKELDNYTLDREGLKKVVTHYGGEKFINSAVDYANSNKKVKYTLDKLGLSPNQLRDIALRELNNNNKIIDGSYKESKSSYRDRLDKLK